MIIDKKFVTPDFHVITQVDLDELNNLIIQTGMYSEKNLWPFEK